jgi:succinate-semialdehyde dehydrogenase/glutarate-semialdehyde dehydrogenase
VLPAPGPDRRLWVWREPIGVTAVLTPWNYPLQQPARKLATLLAAGCTAVLKPSAVTPLSAVALVRIIEAAGIPPGVVNLVNGPPAELGAVLATHPAVRKLTFTGSTAVGRLLMQQAAGTVKSLSLELGGHAPLIVFADADLERAVAGAVTARFRATGQICHSANRILVQDSILPAFRARFAEAVRALRVGPGWENGVEIGPLINEEAVARVERHVADAVAGGAAVLVGGRRPGDPALAAGHFFEPTVLDGCGPDMLVCREETFGPVAPLLSFRDEDDAVALANATPYGLAAYLFRRDVGRAIRVTERLEAGVVGLNDPRASAVSAPFGGIKQSGFGREGGPEGLDEFLVTKSVALSL